MKTTFINSLSLIILIFSINSCSQEETIKQDQVSLDFNDLKINLSNSSFNNQIKVFDFKDKSEMIAKINPSFNQIIEDSRELIKNNSEVTDVIITISFKDGKALISEIIELDIKNNIIRQSAKYDNSKKSYIANRGGPFNPNFANCPSGYTELASCSNINNPSECAGNAAQAYFSENVSGIGDCANVQIQVGTFTTKVCGKTC
uniref:hypothetical protein n=1 Tax=Gelidibacter sp. TaxID=2018083 RepID=UPI00404B8F23